jgi:regulator of protease activity HflC (stomatin/prohibitin superfamily)
MTPLIDRLLDLFLSAWALLVPWCILADDQVGLVRRLGVFHRVLKPGLSWKCPIIDVMLCETSALESVALREQSLCTRDGVCVTLRGIIAYRVVDPKKFIIEVDSPLSVINDVGASMIGELVPELDAAEVLQGTVFLDKLSRKVRARGKQWGVEIVSVGLADRTKARTFRVMGVSQ